ncbi:MAG: PqqD family protein [Planctomycetota bacterium]|jgi:hypothetical protein
MLTDDVRLRWSPGCAFQEIAERIVVVVPSDHTISELNEVGSFLWRLLEEPRPLAELVRRVCAEYEVDEETARADVRAFGEEMVGLGLLEAA